MTGQRHARSHLASLFWPDRDEATARGNLRVVLSNLKRALPDVLDVTRDSVTLVDEARVHVDVVRFERAAEQGLARAAVAFDDAREPLEAALSEYRGELLEGFGLSVGADFEAWLGTEAVRLQVQHRRVLEAVIGADLTTGATPRTVELAELLVSSDRYSEAAMALLLRAMTGVGRRAEALQRYSAWEQALAAEVGIRPTVELLAVVERIRHDRPDGTDRDAAGTLETRLPQFTRLVGRDRELDELERLVKDGERLVTVVGPAGVGKTTTAAVLAHRVHVRTLTPVVHVDLTEVSDGPGLLRAILTYVGDPRPTAVSVEGVRDRLEDRQVVLVLDNFEHLLSHRDLVERLHELCPTVSLIVTSRSPLRLAWERVYELSPLAVPPQTEVDRDELLSASAVRLFLVRADRSGAGFPLTVENLSMTARVCQLLDGIPLAIELAAARLPVLGLPGLVAALEADDSSWHLTVLGRGPNGNAGQRHRSVRDAVAWTYAQLSDAAQELFRRVAVFAGGFDLTAVIGVCADNGAGRDWIVDALAELVDFHLVARVETGAPPVRFRMLVTMRSLAAEALAEHGRTDELRERHARYYLDAVAGATKGSEGRGDAQSLRTFHQDLSNLAAVLDWCHQRGRAVEALRMLDQLGPGWRAGGASSQGLELLSRGLEDAAGHTDLEVYAACAVWRAGLLAERDGEGAAGVVRNDLERSLPTLLGSQDRGMAARCLAEAVHAAAVVGDADRAVSIARGLQERAVSPVERWWSLAALEEVATIAHLGGDDERALALVSELITDARELGHRRIELYGWMWVGLMEADQIGLAEDPPSLAKLLELAAESEDDQYIVWLLVSLGTQAIFAQHLDEAAVRFERAMTIARQIDYRHGLGFALMGLVGLAFFAGNLPEAARFHGVLHDHIDDLRYVMPRTFHEAYLAVAAHLEGAASAEDPAVADALAEGRALPWTDAIAEAHLRLHERVQQAPA